MNMDSFTLFVYIRSLGSRNHENAFELPDNTLPCDMGNFGQNTFADFQILGVKCDATRSWNLWKEGPT